jgi:hypothetical protein
LRLITFKRSFTRKILFYSQRAAGRFISLFFYKLPSPEFVTDSSTFFTGIRSKNEREFVKQNNGSL